MKNILVSVMVLSSFSGLCEICNGWHFRRSGEEWQKVNIPHDDAIRHDFNLKKYDSGCGALPYYGEAEYEKTIKVTPGEWKKLSSGDEVWRIHFDGVMAGASVEVNGEKVSDRPYGYSPFTVLLDGKLVEGENKIRVTINAQKNSSPTMSSSAAAQRRMSSRRRPSQAFSIRRSRRTAWIYLSRPLNG